MSQENVEIVRRSLEDFPRRPNEVASWVAAFWEPDGDFYPVRKFPEARPCHGSEEIERFLVGFLAAWDRWELEPLDVVAVGDACVLARIHVVAEGQGSRLALDGDLYECAWIRHGRYLRTEDHLTLDGAAHALGIEHVQAAGLRE